MKKDDYLYDGAGPPDPLVKDLEGLLSRYAWKGAPETIAPRRPSGGFGPMLVAVAAGALTVAAGLILSIAPRDGETPPADGPQSARLVRGIEGSEILAAAGGKRVDFGSVGWVDVEPGARLRVLSTEPDDHRLFLDSGAATAMILSRQPRTFRIGTPAGVTVDLGCRYRVEVEKDGATFVECRTGAISFETDGRRVSVPAGAATRSLPGRGPSAPWWIGEVDADFIDTVAYVDFHVDPDPARLEAFMNRARVRDGLTLWHLLSAKSAATRSAALRRLAALSPPSAAVDLEGVARQDAAAIAAWKSELDFGDFWFLEAFEKK